MTEPEYVFKFRVQGDQRVKCYDPDDMDDITGAYRVIPVDCTVIAASEAYAMRQAVLDQQVRYDEAGWETDLIMWCSDVKVTQLEKIEVKKKEEPQLTFDLF